MPAPSVLTATARGKAQLLSSNYLFADQTTNKPKPMNLKIILIISLALTCIVAAPGTTSAQDKKPNIVIIWGDDVGQSNISAYTMGLMGYRTPNIDRVAKEGVMFTD